MSTGIKRYKRKYPIKRWLSRWRRSVNPFVLKQKRVSAFPEHFNVLLTTSWDSVSSSGTEVNISDSIDFGGGSGYRTSKSIYFSSFTLKGVVQAGDASNLFRIVLFLAKAGWTTVNALSYEIRPGYNNVVKVFYDRYFSLVYSDTQDPGFQKTDKEIRIAIPLRTKIAYNADNDSSVSLLLYMVSDSAAVTHPGFVCGRYDVIFFSS